MSVKVSITVFEVIILKTNNTGECWSEICVRWLAFVYSTGEKINVFPMSKFEFWNLNQFDTKACIRRPHLLVNWFNILKLFLWNKVLHFVPRIKHIAITKLQKEVIRRYAMLSSSLDIKRWKIITKFFFTHFVKKVFDILSVIWINFRSWSRKKAFNHKVQLIKKANMITVYQITFVNNTYITFVNESRVEEHVA